MKAPPGYPQNAIHVVDISGGAVKVYTSKITFNEGALDPSLRPAEGSNWPGPRCGSTYHFTAPGNKRPPSYNLDEIWTEVEGQIDLLSAHVGTYPPTSGALASFLAALRRQLPQGGRFRINEYGRAFTSDQNLFVGTIPLADWYPPLSLTS